MQKIATVTVGAGGASSIDFTSIPGTFTDLALVFSGKNGTNTTTAVRIALNSSTTGFSSRVMQHSNGSAISFTENTFIGHIPASDWTASTYGSANLYFPNYASNSSKTFSVDNVTESNNSSYYLSNLIGVGWSGTSAITSITLTANFAQYSTATLYGITKGSGGATVS